jgi:hypothetical protein
LEKQAGLAKRSVIRMQESTLVLAMSGSEMSIAPYPGRVYTFPDETPTTHSPRFLNGPIGCARVGAGARRCHVVADYLVRFFGGPKYS